MIIGGGEESVRTLPYCIRSEAPFATQCRPYMSGTRLNLSTIADPYDLTGGDAAGDVQSHGVVWCELREV